MPTEKKRVNLTIPEEVYERIASFRKKNSIPSDAGACLMLIQQQLDNIERTEEMMKMVRQFTPDDLRKINDIGMNQLTSFMESEAAKKKD